MKCPVGPGHADTLCSFGAAHTARRPLFRHGAPRPGSDETGTFCGAVRCGAPACPQIAIPSFPAFPARHLPSPIPLPSPLPLPSPTSEPVHRPLAAALREFSRTSLSPPQGRRHHPQDPAHKNRNFLDLWQTIAQDLSRLFAMPGRCPSRSRSRKDWPALAPMRWAYEKGRPLSCLHRKSRARSASVARSLPESFAVWPEHDARADTDMTTRGRDGHALPPCSPSTAPGDRSGTAARGAATQSHGPE